MRRHFKTMCNIWILLKFSRVLWTIFVLLRLEISLHSTRLVRSILENSFLWAFPSFSIYSFGLYVCGCGFVCRRSSWIRLHTHQTDISVAASVHYTYINVRGTTSEKTRAPTSNDIFKPLVPIFPRLIIFVIAFTQFLLSALTRKLALFLSIFLIHAHCFE